MLFATIVILFAAIFITCAPFKDPPASGVHGTSTTAGLSSGKSAS